MKNKSVKIIICMALMIAFSLNGVLSWGPITHDNLNVVILNNNITDIGRTCNSNLENRAAYLLGTVSPDITVIYYFEEGGKEYKLTHNWNFQQEVMSQAQTEDEKCLAYGIAAHLIQDSISHTQSVPQAIKTYHIPNWLLHPLLEKKYDSIIALKNPQIRNESAHMMDALNGPKADRYIEMMQSALGKNTQVNVKNEIYKLQVAVSGGNFYDSQFSPTGSTLIFQAYPYINKITDIIAPYIGNINYGGIQNYYNKAEEQTINTFNNWGARYQISPHGFDELTSADKTAGSWLNYLLIAIVIIGVVLSYIKKDIKWLLIIPALILAVIVIVYSLL